MCKLRRRLAAWCARQVYPMLLAHQLERLYYEAVMGDTPMPGEGSPREGYLLAIVDVTQQMGLTIPGISD